MRVAEEPSAGSYASAGNSSAFTFFFFFLFLLMTLELFPRKPIIEGP